MKIDFTKFIIEDIEGNEVPVDISRPLGNAIYFGAADISQADLGRDIYKGAPVDVTRENAELIKGFIGTMSWPVKVAFEKIVKEL